MRDNTQNPGKTAAAAEIISCAIWRELKGKYAHSFLIGFFPFPKKLTAGKGTSGAKKKLNKYKWTNAVRSHNCAGVVNHLTLSLRVSFAIAYVQRTKNVCTLYKNVMLTLRIFLGDSTTIIITTCTCIRGRNENRKKWKNEKGWTPRKPMTLMLIDYRFSRGGGGGVVRAAGKK